MHSLEIAFRRDELTELLEDLHLPGPNPMPLSVHGLLHPLVEKPS